MIVGEHNRPSDIEINPTKEKKLTNMRAAGTVRRLCLYRAAWSLSGGADMQLVCSQQDENVRLSPIRTMSLEDVVTYIGEDEMIDVSPTRIRMR